MTIKRQNPEEVQLQAVQTYETLIRTMDHYFGRIDDHDQLSDAIKDRYAVGIKEVKDPSSNSNAVRETYVKRDFATAVDAGLVEAITLGFGQKVSNALATLFTEAGMRMDLQHETVEDLALAEELIDEQREKGGQQAALVEADKGSCQIGSNLVFVQSQGGQLEYHKLSPADVYVIYGDTITETYNDENGTEQTKSRSADVTDLEDASAVIINLGVVDVGINRYVGIVARCDGYKYGRWVEWQGSDGRQLPSDGEDGVIELTFDVDGTEVQANPLSWFAETNPDLDVPEYPIMIIKGGICDTSGLTPITDSLYLDSKEFDVAASHTLSKSQDNISGTTVITRELASPHALPRTIGGVIGLEPGHDAKKLDSGSAGANDALEVLERLMIHCAAGYSVPDYMVVSRDHTLDASSGVALQVKARPLVKNREYRVELNTQAVSKLFDIEKYLLAIHHSGDDEAVNLLLECSQTWDAGKLKLPENKNELVTRLSTMLDKGIIDVLEYIRQYYMLPSDVDAENMYTRMNERKDEFPPLNKEEMDAQRQQQTKQLGLTRNRG